MIPQRAPESPHEPKKTKHVPRVLSIHANELVYFPGWSKFSSGGQFVLRAEEEIKPVFELIDNKTHKHASRVSLPCYIDTVCAV